LIPPSIFNLFNHRYRIYRTLIGEFLYYKVVTVSQLILTAK
jgi:hypothetical protein